MTTAMHDDDIATSGENPAMLRPGTLVYLWPPGVPTGDPDRSLVRVEKATQYHIIGLDLGAEAPGRYEVDSVLPPALRWTWTKVAEPQGACPSTGIPYVQRDELSQDERRNFLFGEDGATVTVHAVNGPPVSGVVSKVVMDGDKPVWVEISGAPDDPRGIIRHRIRFEHIVIVAQVTRG